MVSLRKALVGINLFTGFGTLIYYQINGILKELSVLNTVEAYLRKNNLSPLSTHLHTKSDLDHWNYLIGVNAKENKKVQDKSEFIKINEAENILDNEDKKKNEEEVTTNLFKRKCKKLLTRQIPHTKELSTEYVTAAKWCVKAKTVLDTLEDENMEALNLDVQEDQEKIQENKFDIHRNQIVKVAEHLKIMELSIIKHKEFCFTLFQQRSLDDHFNEYLDLSKKICVKKQA